MTRNLEIFGGSDMIYYNWIGSPVGELLLTADGQSLTGLYPLGQTAASEDLEDWDAAPQLDVLVQTQVQLNEYFAHQRQAFHLPLKPQGTKFQKKVWQHLLQIPFGQPIADETLAQRVGKTSVSRAIAAAHGQNPIAIIIASHRVIVGDGEPIHAGGIDRHQWLRHHEQAKLLAI